MACESGKLKRPFVTGTRQIKVRKCRGEYVGEVNKEGQAHGFGTFRYAEFGHEYQGTFRHDNLDGYCRFADEKNNWTRIGEVD